MSVVRDPRSDAGAGYKNPATGTNSMGGLRDAAGVDLGNGVAAVVVISATRTASAPAASTTSTQLVAASLKTIAVTVTNNDTVAMALGYGTAAVIGTNPVAAGATVNVPANKVTGQINVIWAASGSVAASLLVTAG